VLDHSRPGSVNGPEHFTDKRQQIRHPVRRRVHDPYAEGEAREVLLLLDVAVHRDEDVALAAGALQEGAVLRAGPSKTLGPLRLRDP
jgi:hypothetical protein